MAVNRQANISRAIDNVTRLILLTTEVIANPTQANIDAVVSAATSTNQLRVLADHALDGESYNWTAYVKSLTEQLEALRKAEQTLGGPFEVRSYVVFG